MTKTLPLPTEGKRHQAFRAKLEELKDQREQLTIEVDDAKQRRDAGEVADRFVELAQERLSKCSRDLNDLQQRWADAPGKCQDEDLRRQRKLAKKKVTLQSDEIVKLGKLYQSSLDDLKFHEKNIEALENAMAKGPSWNHGLIIERDLKSTRFQADEAKAMAEQYQQAAQAAGQELARLDGEVELIDAEIREL